MRRTRVALPCFALPLGALLLTACPTAPPEGEHRLSSPAVPAMARVVPAARRAPPPPRGARRRPASVRPTPVVRRASPAPRIAPAEDPRNQVPPRDEAAWLDRMGRALLAAIAAGDPALGRDFFFPRRPFTPLKRAANPDRYWQHLVHLFERDVRALRRRQLDWSGATFESLRLAAPPRWIAPGREANHIGYYRTHYARLRYRYRGRRYSLFLHTLITWQGRWYITHLRKPPRRKKR